MPDYSPAVTCYEEHGSVSENWTLDGVSMSVKLRCAWADRYALIADLLDNARTWPHGAFADPPVAQSAALSAFETEFTVSGQSITYQDALITVSYGTSTGTDLIAESLEPTAEFITQDYRHFRWDSLAGDPLVEGEAPGKLRRGLALSRTMFKVTSLPTIILTGVGGVNHAPYTSSLLGLTFDEETLLFQPPVANRTIKTDGSTAWTLATKFMFKPEGWNKYWRAEDEEYQSIYDIRGSGTPYKNYPLVNFSSLLS